MSTEPEMIEAPDRRISPIYIIGLVVVVLAVLFWFVVRPLFLESAEEPLPPIADPAPSAQTAEPAEEADEQAPPEETFEVFESKDPFRPLVTTSEATGTTAGTDGDTGATSGASGAPAPTGGEVVTVIDVFTEDGTDMAQIKVGSTVYTVSVGEVFANNYKLVSTSGDCATLLRGDDKFTLCEGQEVIK